MIQAKHIQCGKTGKLFAVQVSASAGPWVGESSRIAQVEEHFLKVELGVRFRSTEDRYEAALQDAKQAVIREVYGELLQVMSEVKMAAHAHDTHRILTLCEETEHRIQYGDPSQ